MSFIPFGNWGISSSVPEDCTKRYKKLWERHTLKHLVIILKEKIVHMYFQVLKHIYSIVLSSK
jgi:hypothetical protein